ncbi:hypothetical protein M6B38_261635 [Iris pallida]|uniref:Uncharacterized protein n=1 Tax=Iris pallida TaxID=29817 RepID=A0AAX6G3D2_IRIPA|nr:hypothetical protein M6B38_384795 [Iris pallida]KAJ6851305.1 hypothetical protein M6B38_261635 [Iris pallida]
MNVIFTSRWRRRNEKATEHAQHVYVGGFSPSAMSRTWLSLVHFSSILE